MGRVLVQPDGKIIVGGGVNNPSGGGRFLLLRLLPDGSPDPTFGTDGQSLLAVGAAENCLGDIALQANGNIVGAGRASNSLAIEFWVVDRVTGSMLWANLHLLFWLSLVPFVTNWMGEHGHAALPTAMYGVVLLCAGISYTILVRVIIHAQGPHSKLKAAVGGDSKGNISLALYVTAILLTLVRHQIAWAFYALVALIWLVPDKRIERVL